MTLIDIAAGATDAAWSDDFPSPAPMRIVVFADMFGASQSIAFVEGLAQSRSEGGAAVRIVEEAAFGPDAGARTADASRALAEAHLAETAATVVVLSRFGHLGGYDGVRAAAAARGLPVLFHIDDDLFDLPASAGVERYRSARHPRRAHALGRALREADMVISATEVLALRIAPLAGHGRIGWLENGTAGRPGPRPARTPANAPVVIGYMGSASHGPDLELAVPALQALLAGDRKVRLELFGSIARQPVADLLPGNVVRHDVVPGDYAAFKRRLAGLGWDIGLAPLAATPYNRCKTPTKWAEYAEAGIATLASDIEVYGPMIAAGAAAPATRLQWAHALDRLVGSWDLRQGIVESADRLLRARYGWDRLEASVVRLLERGRPLRAAA